MTDWYFHAPGEGRVGPFSAEALAQRFREGQIQHDTLVWHAAMPEWQPLERVSEQLGLASVRPDPSRPPPVPRTPAAGVAAPSAARTGPAMPAGKYSRQPLREKRTLSTGAITLIVVLLLGIPTALVVGSSMLSSYRSYALRASRMGRIDGVANGLQQVVDAYEQRFGRCVTESTPRLDQVKRELRQRAQVDVSFEAIHDGCSFEVAFTAQDGTLAGKSLRFEGHRTPAGLEWQCVGGTLAEADRPPRCRGH